MKKGNLDLTFDKAPTEVLEDRFVTPPTNKQLRRTNPKREDKRENQLNQSDSDVSNRYDNEINLISSLENLDWEIDNYILGKVIGKTSSKVFSFKEFQNKLKERFHIYNKVYSWQTNLENILNSHKKSYNTYKETTGRSPIVIQGVPIKVVEKYIPSITSHPERPFPIGYEYIYNLEIGEVVPWDTILELLKFHRVGSNSDTQTVTITYTGLPEDVRRFIETHFEKELETYPTIRERLDNLFIGPLPLPEDYDVNVAAEYKPEENFIAYYLPFESLKRNYEGIVHEICHLFQDFFDTNNISSDWRSPKVDGVTYRTGGLDYRNDKGEIQALEVVKAFQNYKLAAFENYLDMNKTMFEERFRDFGEKGGNIFWSSDKAQYKRFEALTKIFSMDVDLSKSSLLDVGCGYGDLIDYLEGTGHTIGTYVGIDIVEPIIKIARKKHPDKKFIIGDVFEEVFVPEEYTYIFASGIFALEDRVWEEYVIRTLERLYDLCTVGVAVNFLQGEVKYGALHYTSKEVVERLASIITDNYKILDNYLSDDLTLFLYK